MRFLISLVMLTVEFRAEENQVGSWEEIKVAPIEERRSHSGVMHGNRLVIWGGTGSDGKYYNDGAIFDLVKKEREKLTHAP